MTKGHRTTIDVDLLAIQIELANKALSHDRERLVDFPHIDIVFSQPSFQQDFLCRWHRRVQHQRGAIAHVGCGQNPRPGRHAALFHVSLRGQQERRGAIDHTRGVARVVNVIELGNLGVLLLDERTIGGTRLIDWYIAHHAEDGLQLR